MLGPGTVGTGVEPNPRSTRNSVSALFELVSKNKNLQKPVFEDTQVGSTHEQKHWRCQCIVRLNTYVAGQPVMIPVVGHGAERKKKLAHTIAAEHCMSEITRIQNDPDAKRDALSKSQQGITVSTHPGSSNLGYYQPQTQPAPPFNTQFKHEIKEPSYQNGSTGSGAGLAIDVSTLRSVLPLVEDCGLDIHAFVPAKYAGFRARGISIHEAKLEVDDSTLMGIVWWVAKSVAKLKGRHDKFYIASMDPRVDFVVKQLQEQKIDAQHLQSHEAVEQMLQQAKQQHHAMLQAQAPQQQQPLPPGSMYNPEEASLQLPAAPNMAGPNGQHPHPQQQHTAPDVQPPPPKKPKLEN